MSVYLCLSLCVCICDCACGSFVADSTFAALTAKLSDSDDDEENAVGEDGRVVLWWIGIWFAGRWGGRRVFTSSKAVL